jgi:2-oxoisovalerate dehydrogenase E1 component alpha subunit
MTNFTPSTTLIRDLYARMLLTRIVDDCAWRLHKEGRIDFVVSSRGHEAAQVGSAICIEVGTDFTLPYYRDLGVVLTIGMSPYEVFRTYLQMHAAQARIEHGGQADCPPRRPAPQHWGYHKHNAISESAPVATQILHAAGIAFACKLRKASAVTVAYCGDGATTEPDFLEGISFAAQHQLPVVFICEQDCTHSRVDAASASSCTGDLALPAGLTHRRIDGANAATVYAAMRAAMQHARDGHGPVLLEMYVTRSTPDADEQSALNISDGRDPLLCCQRLLEEQGLWDDAWAAQLYARISAEVEQAMQDALRDNQPNQ